MGTSGLIKLYQRRAKTEIEIEEDDSAGEETESQTKKQKQEEQEEILLGAIYNQSDSHLETLGIILMK